MKTLCHVNAARRLLVALPLLAGCAHEGAHLPQATTTSNVETGAPFVLLGEGLQRAVTSSGIEQSTSIDGRMAVAARLRNRTQRALRVDASCVFKDAQGFAVDETPFVPVLLQPGGEENVRFDALNPRAVHFTVRVRESR